MDGIPMDLDIGCGLWCCKGRTQRV